MNKRMLAAGLGAAAMFFLDPEAGNRRRIHLRQKAVGKYHDLMDFFDVSFRDLKNRVNGIFAHIRYRLRRDIDDETLVERVAAQMGRHVSHPRAIDLDADDGTVTVRGPILASEEGHFLKAVKSVPGVKDVRNELDVHEAADIPSLQGGRERVGHKSEFMQANWTPSLRLLATIAGAGMLRPVLTGPTLLTGVLGGGGFLLMVRGMTNQPIRQALGFGGRRRNISVQKNVIIDAPLEEVFGFFSDFTNYPRFMHNVRDVSKMGDDGHYHWTVAGPAGIRVHWNAEVTDLEPNKYIAWRSDADSAIGNVGRMRFEEQDDGRTRVSIMMSYNPPAGIVGHGVATLFGSDPKTGMDGDLARAKTYLETGKPARDAAQSQKGTA